MFKILWNVEILVQVYLIAHINIDCVTNSKAMQIAKRHIDAWNVEDKCGWFRVADITTLNMMMFSVILYFMSLW